MNATEFLQSVAERATRLMERGEAAVDGLTSEDLNTNPEPGLWSPAQVFEHMRITNAPYLAALPEVIRLAPRGESDARHTWLGRIMVKATGPSGNAPAPKVLHPGKGPFGEATISAWKDQTLQIGTLAKAAEGVDLVRTKLSSPFLKLLNMNLVDCFEILVAHTERHVIQIEERAARIRKA